MNNNFRLESLDGNIKVAVTSDHGFGIDAFLLSYFSKLKNYEMVCDLGTGCGIIPLILSQKGKFSKIYGIDIQEKAINQFKCGIENSYLENQVIPILEDIRTFENPEKSEFGLVTCNPPYKLKGSGILNHKDAKIIARHEVLCNINDVCAAANRLLKFSGRLCICQRPERLADVITAMKNNNIEPKRLRFVCKSFEDDPWLFLIEGKKGSKPYMKVEKNLYVYENNSYSKEMLEVYGRNSLDNKL